MSAVPLYDEHGAREFWGAGGACVWDGALFKGVFPGVVNRFVRTTVGPQDLPRTSSGSDWSPSSLSGSLQGYLAHKEAYTP